MAINVDSFIRLTGRVGMFHHSTNIGVVMTGEDLLLIDTGSSPQDGEALYETLGKIFPGKTIKNIFITHSHADHCGGNAKIISLVKEEKETCTVWATERESHLMALPGIMGDLYWGAVAIDDVHRLTFDKVESACADRILPVNEKIEMSEQISIRAIPLPGHYYDQVGILVHDKAEHKRIFFLADGFFGASMIKKYWIPFMQNPEEFRNSVEKIEHTKADFFIPSHGDIYDSENINAIAELNSIITYETEILITKLLKEKPRTAEELVAAIADFSGIKFQLSQYVLIGYTIRCYLTSLHNANIVSYDLYENKILWRA